MSDYHNPLSVIIPNSFPSQHDYPTEVIAQRFQAYRYIVKDLVTYLRQYASVQEEIVRQQVRLQLAAGSAPLSISGSSGSRATSSHGKTADKEAKDELSLINHYFLPIGNGSIQDIPTILTKFHQQNVQNGNKTLKEINQVIIPKLEDLRKDLLVKIKEIKNLQNDFKNSLAKEINETKALLNQFNHATDVANHLELLNSSGDSHHDGAHDVDSVKNDPYLVKLKLDRQLKRQLAEEGYLYDAYKNLQTSSEKLESIVVLEIQNYFRMFLGLIETEHSTLPNFLVPSLTNGFLAKEANFEWDSFIERNLPKASNISNSLVSGKFIDLTFPSRKISDLNIPHYDSLVNVAVREGTLEKRSKFLKSYSSGWYVLTCSYIHEFKTPDRRKDNTPVMSLSLDFCLVSEHSKNDGKLSGAYKFVLYSKLQNGLIHRGHNWVFRCDTYQSMIEWYNDIKTLTSLASPAARAKAMSKKLQANNLALDKRVSRASSILSAGARSSKSNGTSTSKIQNRLSPKISNATSRSVAPSHTQSITSTQNPRLSSTFSQKFQQSPKLSNLINSDGTIVTPIETQADDTYDEVDQNGDVTVTTQKSEPINQASVPPAQSGSYLTPLAFPVGQGFQNQVTPQQSVPQNYQYYVNQVTPQPQQFYDPVLQQFFTINAIPALQVSLLNPGEGAPQVNGVTQGQNVPGDQPKPQYFPSSPQPNNGAQYFAASPNLQPQVAPKSPRLNQGHFIPVQNDGVMQYNQFIPHFPQQFNEGVTGGPPYPVLLGENLVSSRQGSNASRNGDGVSYSSEIPNPTISENVDKAKSLTTLDEQASKLTMTDENAS